MTRRRATVALTLALLYAAPAYSGLGAQPRPAMRDPKAQGLLVAVFASPDRVLGVEVADAIRSRATSAANPRQLFVIPWEVIKRTLEDAGFRPDSALGPTDLAQLARLLRADEVIFGVVTKTATGIRVEPRLLRATDITQGQALGIVDGSDAGDVGRPVERAYVEARKQLPDNRICENGIRDRKFDVAIAAANAGIAKYPNATFARLCLATAHKEMKAAPDSVLRVVDEIRRIDPKNSFALRLAYGAYGDKGDKDNSVRALVELYKLEPTNHSLIETIIRELAGLGKPLAALEIIESLLKDRPGDPQLLRQRWQLALAAGAASDSVSRAAAFARAVAYGEEMVRGDTTLADSTFFARQIIAANAMTPPRGLEVASLAVRKFPNNAEFWALKANAERKAGQTQLALESMNRAIQLNPKTPNGNLFLATIHLEMNRPDTAVAIARRAVASGEDARQWGAFLLAPTRTIVQIAQRTDSVEHWQRALALGQEADRLAPSEISKFMVGLTSFQVGADGLRLLNLEQRRTRPDRPRVCSIAKNTQDLFVITQTTMMAGGKTDPQAAAQILGAVRQYGAPLDEIISRNCR